MIIAVSPYHLTTREAPAMAALLLGERVVTMLPAPAQADAAVAQQAAGRVPAYREFMRTWAWTAPLWEAGVIVSDLDGEGILADMRAVSGQVAREPHLAPLRRFMHDELY